MGRFGRQGKGYRDDLEPHRDRSDGAVQTEQSYKPCPMHVLGGFDMCERFSALVMKSMIQCMAPRERQLRHVIGHFQTRQIQDRRPSLPFLQPKEKERSHSSPQPDYRGYGISLRSQMGPHCAKAVVAQ